MLGKLLRVLRQHPGVRLSSEQEQQLVDLQEQYAEMHLRYSQRLPQNDPLVELYLESFVHSIRCILLIRHLFRGGDAPDRQEALLARCSTMLDELQARVEKAETATAVRYAELYLRNAAGQSPSA